MVVACTSQQQGGVGRSQEGGRSGAGPWQKVGRHNLNPRGRQVPQRAGRQCVLPVRQGKARSEGAACHTTVVCSRHVHTGTGIKVAGEGRHNNKVSGALAGGRLGGLGRQLARKSLSQVVSTRHKMDQVPLPSPSSFLLPPPPGRFRQVSKCMVPETQGSLSGRQQEGHRSGTAGRW